MCGIVGIFSPARPIDSVELENFTKTLVHRGPDGYATRIEGSYGLGHTRLAILDLSERGQNPLLYQAPSGVRYWIVFNGEIYNFLEIRAELRGFGYSFETETDTEVIAAAYDKWGRECLHKFNGMWSFAILNSNNGELFVVRDRFGIKPLYFHTGARFSFSSELKSFMALRDFQPEFNYAVGQLLLQNSYAYEGLTDQTLYKGVQRLLPGCCLMVNMNGSVKVERWWTTTEHLPSIPSSYAGQVEQFRELFQDAVRIRMRSDVPIGTCLSGGLDSSAVACMMHHIHSGGSESERRASEWQNLFVASFPGSAIDETKHAKSIADYIGVAPKHWTFDAQAALADLVDSLWSTEDVYGGILVPMWSLYRKLRQEKVLVSLDGHGSDELFAGYTFNLGWKMGELNQKLLEQFHVTLLPSILRNYDRCSAAHGVEVRMPFMDWRIVTFAFALPPEAKTGGGYTKRILRDAMEGIMPDNIRLRRQKIGFNSPMIEWYNSNMIKLFETVFNHKKWKENPLFNGKEFEETVRSKSASKSWGLSDWEYTLHVWTHVNLVLWEIMFVDRDNDMLGELRSRLQ